MYLCCASSWGESLSINVYLKLKPNNQVAVLIKNFNDFLNHQGILTHYSLNPFIDSQPLHITLYLAEYDTTHVPKIIEQVKLISRQHEQIQITTQELNPNPSGYLMLTVNRSKELLKLSGVMLKNLAFLRDKTASIPSWAANNKEQLALFNRYGSPGVLQFYNPHFSIFDPQKLNPRQRLALYKLLQHSIKVYEQSHKIQVQASAFALGVGIADAQGQITKELASFKLIQPGSYQ
jgi:hypothetical protein